MHSIELERKLRLPNPSKTIEGVFKLLKRTRQQLDTTQNTVTKMSAVSEETLKAKKRAGIEAERRKAHGITYAMRTSIR